MTRCSVNIAVQYFIILWRLPALESPEQFGKRRGGNASANRGNQIPARISITTRSLCASISSQNRTLFTSTPIIRSRRTPQLLAAPTAGRLLWLQTARREPCERCVILCQRVQWTTATKCQRRAQYGSASVSVCQDSKKRFS